ncbi:MAG: response regulator [Elusimicrobiota bacterium]
MDKKILIIEDNKYNLEIAEVALSGAGFKIITASDGKEGLSKIDKNLDLILLDLSLPKISGEEIVKKVREDDSLKDLPVIALTAHAMDGDRERALQFGCSSYLSKPCKPPDLVAEVNKFI